ncbi:MFS transporter [Kocuria sp. TGY1127_2]|uniref:MFS transporter n=1 Tax=Kocuria sp. TGY1127_2 TaxID=2711328 RepID=UPI0018D97EAB|nr:MFS transporter [Kocuria sp. TGY1127_2]
MTSTKPGPQLTRAVLFLMCLATGLCAGGNYFNQPLLEEISQALGVSSSTAATSVTVAQVSYAVGLVFLTPLGDLFERRKLTVGLIGLTAVGQLVAGFAPAFGVFMIGIAVAGLFSVAAQILVPYAAILAEPGKGGKAVGTVMSGLLAGVLIARAVAGILSDIGGWTLIYHVAAVLMILVGIGLWRVLPPSYPENPPSYLGLFTSMARLIRRHPRLRTRSLISGISFASMSAVFATTTLLLADDPFRLSPTAIGLVGLTGLAGALMASVAGGMVDRGLGRRATVLGLIALALGWGAFILGGHSVLWFCVGMVLTDVGVQLVHIISMNTVYTLDASARARLNSVYMTMYFVGAAVGSAVGVWAWNTGHWAGVCIAGLVMTALCVLVWLRDVQLENRQAGSEPEGLEK